ncbi:MAG: response regulator [Rhodothermaceae bacterium]|nr:response regulator [Rhodothermaceae bacterium]
MFVFFKGGRSAVLQPRKQGVYIWFVFLAFAGSVQWHSSAFSQSLNGSDYILDHWQAEDGLPHSAITSITQSQDGYLWMGTGSGLVRFDGLRFINVFKDKAPHLVDSYVWSIIEDDSGVLWIGTSNGLSKYEDQRFKTFSIDEGLPNNFVRTLLKDDSGRLWVGTYGGGICVFNIQSETCEQVAGHEGVTDLFVNVIVQDRHGIIWVGTDTGLLRWEDGTWREVENETGVREQVKALIEDKDGRLWVGTSKGVFIHSEEDQPEAIKVSGFESVQAVRSFFEDRDGYLWIGTESGGLFRYKDGEQVQFDAEAGLAHNYIWNVFQDLEGSLWIGTNGGGLNRLKIGRVQVYGVAEGLPDNSVNTLLEDGTGAFWFGTSNGLARLEGNTITRYTEEDGLANDRVFSLAEDQQGDLWIGTNGGGLSRLRNGTFQNWTTEDGLLSDVIFSTYVDSKGVLWVGTTRGLNQINQGEITSYTVEDGLPKGFAVVIKEGLHDDLWIGTDAGLAHFREGVFSVYTTEDGLPSDAIRALFFDSKGTLWIGTRGGLSRMVNGAFQSFTTEQGLPDNVVYHIDIDDAGHLWINTSRSGILRIPVAQFDELVTGTRASISPLMLGRSDGMRSIEGVGGFQPAGLKDNAGHLWFLTHGGAVVVEPEKITPDPFSMPIHIEEIVADSVSLSAVDGSVTVPYNTNRLRIRYTGLSFLEPNRIVFRHQLEGLERDWNYESSDDGFLRTREFTRLSPGTYTFRVSGANRDGIWSANEATLRFIVPPPWWRTSWAFLGYVLALCLGVYGIVRWRVIALEMRNKALEKLIAERTHQVSQQARRLEELDALKSRFFANISHEFRTPLTLILGSSEEMRERGVEGSTLRFVNSIEKQGKQLLNLVSQLLDLSRVDAGAVAFLPKIGNLEPFIRQIVSSFMPLAERKGISLEFHASAAEVPAAFDAEKLKQVIDNVLSNAFKYTEEAGKVHVSLDASGATANIIIRDTGQGIAAEDLPHIFDRFYLGRSTAKPGVDSSGIGLALAKELIELHEGTISVESTAGFGSAFTIQLPLNNDTPEEVESPSIEAPSLSAIDPDLEEIHEADEVKRAEDKPLVLLVDDNAEVRMFVRRCLEGKFRVTEVESGEDALLELEQGMPDLMLCDIMMAGMNGFELCRMVKEDTRYKHIPIILLTARASAESMEEGLQAGADDYVIKPFSANHLRLRIQNAIASRGVLREKYSRELVVKPANVSIESADESFLRRAMEVVEEFMGESTFGVDTLAAELGLSRRQLQRRLRDVSDISPSEFIRNMRLERAAQLLERDMGTVSEIAYKVGFRKPSHFSELFRKKFGKSPTEYRT